jgi:hypothetical protein
MVPGGVSMAGRDPDFFSRIELTLVKIALLVLLFISLTKLIWIELASLIAELMQ